MKLPKLLLKHAVTVSLILLSHAALAQVEIQGTVYDRALRPMPGVSVLGTSGTGTATDSLGHYHIKLPDRDSIYFSYLGKATMKYAVKEITPGVPFDMSLQTSIESLPEVMVRSSDYHMDSLRNRMEYQKIFDYDGRNVVGNMSTGAGIGIDFDALLHPQKYRNIERLKKRLEEEEREKYIDHRFSRSLVQKITGLSSPALDTFMVRYRPSYEFIQSCETDYEYYSYIKEWGKFFQQDWNESHK